jgi:pyruvate/2-oxoglutarate dehydrogenase complex dihydrolipoamide acyltransferase (E2) component
VQVGTRIAVTAEPGDDISSLEIPAEDNPAPKKADAAKEESSKEPSKKEPSPPSKEERHSAPAPTEPSSGVSKKSGGKGQKQTYPLYPSVQHLLKENGLPKEEADKIPATGPSGRLLKGDVLAYLGKVEDSYNAEQSKRIGKLAHLDLSNIKLAAPKATPAPEKAAAKEETPAVEKQNTPLALPISLKAVEECQKRLQAALGVFIPVSTLIARASELANEDLPVQNTAHPSADELFNDVLGLPKKKYARGRFTPEMKTGYQAPALSTRTPKSKTPDILDHLFGKKPVSRPVKASPPRAANVGEPVHFLSVKVPDGEGKRALIFLNRVKTLLEEEPGRLVV